jgi:predicted ATPase/class 3 adenylate cyclase
MADLPTGTVTFLFTDLEGSTRLWEQYPEAMKEALARHDEILRRAIAAHDGYVVKMTGDGVHAAFADVGDAIGAALDAQRTLSTEDWSALDDLRVRMGIHTGRSDYRDGDYYGPAVNRAARLMSVAHGGQVIVSLATEELVRDALPHGASLLDLGEHVLRDLQRSERVFQLSAEGLSGTFPALHSLNTYPTNLPIQLSSFVGRVVELEAVQKALVQARVVTLTGVGGSGKTRLALQVGAEVLPSFADGVWLCELAAATDADVLVQVVAASLGVNPSAGTTLEEGVIAFLRHRELLVILDNCEHLIDAAGRLTESIASSCPGVRVLATSREGLAVEGERLMPLRSLPTPGVSANVADVVASDAARLFAERADAARPGFAIEMSNVKSVAEICRRLDGMPLAIELAAARVGSIRPVDIAALLDERFRLLTGGRRTAVERHQTLRATVDWSYSLLDERDRFVFDRLGVFAGSFDVVGATAVVSDDSVERWDVFDAISSLVGKSMIVDEQAPDGTTRFSMLETLRQYARERLDDNDDVDRWRRRHAEYYATLVNELVTGLRGPDEFAWRSRFRTELDNLRAAVNWALDAAELDDVDLGFTIIALLTTETLGDRAAGIGMWAERAVELFARHGVPAGVWAAAAWRAHERGDFAAAIERASAGIANCAADDVEALTLAYTSLTLGASHAGEVDMCHAAAADGFRALERVPTPDRPRGVVMLASAAAYVSTREGDFESARLYAAQALDAGRDVGNPTYLSGALWAYGRSRLHDEPDAALAAFSEAIALVRAGAGDASLSELLLSSAVLLLGRDPTSAIEALREAFVFSGFVSDLSQIATGADRGATVFQAVGAPQAAAVLLGAACGPLDASTAIDPVDRAARQMLAEKLRGELGDDGYGDAAARGRAMSPSELVDFALGVIDEWLTERANG